jgi:hypothetical protein
MAAKPLSDLMFDWLTVLQNKSEGLAAYDKYLRDAEAAGSAECAAMFKKLRDQDTRLVEEVKAHVFGMIARAQAGK